MDEEYYITLSKVRLDRAGELLTESKEILEKGYYKSANNRAFYAMEKAARALLARRIRIRNIVT
ncbi:MAG: HEPN domain-containing protein [Lachnospiraceae bacterium]|nr:HEPN domain-containing protein [Lachnospiraceae bacterium]